MSARLAPHLEVNNLIMGLARPADVLIPVWDQGICDAALDVTIINPLQDKYCLMAGQEVGFALGGAKHIKMAGAHQAYVDTHIMFQPIAFESLGGWDTDALILGKKIAR